MRTAVCGSWWALAKALVIVDRGVVFPGEGPPVICLECTGTGSAATFMGLLTGDVHLINATVPLISDPGPGQFCAATVIGAPPAFGQCELNGIPFDCAALNLGVSLNCYPEGHLLNVLDVDYWRVSITAGFHGGYCYSKLTGSSPIGSDWSVLFHGPGDPFGCADNHPPGNTPGALTVS